VEGDDMTFEEALRADVRALLHEEVAMLRAELTDMLRTEMRAAARALCASDPGDILSVQEAAVIYKVMPKTIRAKIRTGQLQARRSQGSRLYRIRRSDLDFCFAPTDGGRTERTVEEQAASILSNIHRLPDK